MYSYFVSYFRFCSAEEVQIHKGLLGATLHVAYPILSIPCLLMPWRLKSPGHQQAWYWPSKPEYSAFSIRSIKCFRHIEMLDLYQSNQNISGTHLLGILISFPRYWIIHLMGQWNSLELSTYRWAYLSLHLAGIWNWTCRGKKTSVSALSRKLSDISCRKTTLCQLEVGQGYIKNYGSGFELPVAAFCRAMVWT